MKLTQKVSTALNVKVSKKSIPRAGVFKHGTHFAKKKCQKKRTKMSGTPPTTATTYI